MALGAGRPGARHAAHRLPCGHGAARPAPLFSQRLLSDEEALTPAEDCYHRLLTPGERDELELVEAYLKTNSLTALYDSVFIPVLIAAETDHRLELLDEEQRLLVEQSTARHHRRPRAHVPRSRRRLMQTPRS